MGTAKRTKRQSLMKEVTPEILSNSHAANQLSFKGDRKQAKQDPGSRAPSKKEQKRALLYGSQRKSKHQREVLAKRVEKNLPILNKSIKTGLKIKTGKKGKKFIEDNDTLILQRLAKTIGDKQDEVIESKLEKDRRLEEIRELKRLEIERREKEKQEKLENAKLDIKSKASNARSSRRKAKRDQFKQERRDELESMNNTDENKPKKKAKKSVAFAATTLSLNNNNATTTTTPAPTTSNTLFGSKPTSTTTAQPGASGLPFNNQSTLNNNDKQNFLSQTTEQKSKIPKKSKINALLDGCHLLPTHDSLHDQSGLSILNVNITPSLNELCEISNLLNKKLSKIGDNLTRAHYLLSGSGFNVHEAEQFIDELKKVSKNKRLTRASKNVSSRIGSSSKRNSSVTNNKIDVYLKDKKQQNILASIEESLNVSDTALPTVLDNDTYAQRKNDLKAHFGLSSNSKQHKKSQSILLKGSPDLDEFAIESPNSTFTLSSSLGRKSRSNTTKKFMLLQTFPNCKINVNSSQTQRDAFEAYAKIVYKHNSSKESFSNNTADSTDSLVDMIYQYLYTNSDNNQLNNRHLLECLEILKFQTDLVQKDLPLNKKSQLFLEQQFHNYILEYYSKSSVNEGLPSTVNKYIHYISSKFQNPLSGEWQSSNLTIVNSIPIWCVLYFLLRGGCVKEATDYIISQKTIFNKICPQLSNFFKHFAKEEQLLNQIEYNNNVIENDYNVEKNSVQSNIESINQTFTELCQKRDNIQQDLFQDLSTKLGFSVLEYEKTTGSFLREMKKELDLITREILQLNSKITFEEQKKNNIQNSATDLANIINNSEQILKDLDTEESEAIKLISENEDKLETTKVELNDYKSTVKEEIQKIEYLELEVNDIKQKVEETSAEQFSIKNDIDTLSEHRFSILKTCRMNAIEIPLEDNVVFSDVKFEFMNDINEFNIDYDKLDKSLLKSKRKKLTDDEIDSQFQQKISVLEEELISLQPNVHAQERLNEIQAKFDDYNNHVVAELKQKEKKISTEFNKVKNDRKKTFMQTYEHVVKHIDSVYKELTTDPHNTNNLLAGGSATLSIEYNEDSDNASSDEPYLAGLKYQATPPLKKFKEIEYLSGGEKTVAALALLFTINSFKPSPFFILDEIDAALDFVNVLRVSNYIKKHANKDMQFIVISLKNSIYEESDSLVGVYRDQKLNSSRILTLDLSQYE
ncbi:P-loop containing nucleoside triphosphate hydrolase protein [Hanseniaspora valbyensis NRRL Y-1626]|uniref:p-loop containing nucleoside triphosphate hydrolase protein n=1 Tax=Hanseniaspora valbyensis NRRL Y-1626 TaxID=766949 RepID=A0A1B7TGY1_9ASCO|nr:P-loop containing nucleoside triphosphate hydrolase protein [Hanseniaspora valbyensis NRRL Y-1626]